jgi:hypothetical protein
MEPLELAFWTSNTLMLLGLIIIELRWMRLNSEEE